MVIATRVQPVQTASGKTKYAPCPGETVYATWDLLNQTGSLAYQGVVPELDKPSVALNRPPSDFVEIRLPDARSHNFKNGVILEGHGEPATFQLKAGICTVYPSLDLARACFGLKSKQFAGQE
jgi:hypothetical protein